ncbi:hypothetical protein JX265_000005 [Neoarthrinium moseri]|uniref:Uncharacterized protein n=1 Tax=Neoarthrinium moseri TaxID=1658444 RepID=A0A9P9WXP6_9PEZI|nr:uncharacterized protein JN550_001292 [Neoarthrinium moseri]KAI1845816.1 hypothetical protein JX266_008181 [Neoarthrinium moseri]KAI1877220.1 hypothetical protein JN550_001292 [Neoarthrinium moseri]KAI1881179.1 hypothetical protein JX265_000005 [Neoarthrinium moseri]
MALFSKDVPEEKPEENPKDKKGKSKDKKDKKDKKGKGKEDDDKPGLKRPGTSGTENILITNRKEAMEQFAKAQRAEKVWRAKKQATAARENYTETKTHFRECFSHFKLAFTGLFAVMLAIPHLIRDKKEQRRKKADAARRARDLERKKKLEEALARQSIDTTVTKLDA